MKLYVIWDSKADLNYARPKTIKWEDGRPGTEQDYWDCYNCPKELLKDTSKEITLVVDTDYPVYVLFDNGKNEWIYSDHGEVEPLGIHSPLASDEEIEKVLAAHGGIDVRARIKRS